ncbi:FecR family protein [Pelagibius sp.]|uniref:FecR family protein n=1 Tax=Pelagibius sp. TaxID=1931238 RepID=UPI003BB04A96
MTTKQMPQTASEWIVAMNDAPDDEALRRGHDAWLSASEDNRRDWDETLQVWRLMSMTVPAHAEDWVRPAGARAPDGPQRQAAIRAVQAGRHVREPEGRRRSWIRRRLPAVAGVALAACLALVLMPEILLFLRADHSSATGEIKVVDLQDGSRIRLAPESAVALTFEPSARRIELLRGEAFFEVAADRDRPFRVRAGAAETAVLGTRFGVSLSETGATIAVEEGAVRVRALAAVQDLTTRASRLSAGDVLRMAPDGGATAGRTDPSLIAAWRRGKLVAQNQSFAELAAVLDRYFDGWIVIADADLARQPLTGIYTLSDPRAALRAMARTQGATLREVSPWILVVSRR